MPEEQALRPYALKEIYGATDDYIRSCEYAVFK
jgi:hypothetical protein